jgi:branched-subunit amino acid transport protein
MVSPSRIEVWAMRLDRLPRTARIVLSFVITLVLTAVVSVFVDRVLLNDMSDSGTTPALVAVAVGVVLYILGWWTLVGFDGNPTEPWRASAVAVLYVSLGVAGLFILVMLILIGLAQGYIL